MAARSRARKSSRGPPMGELNGEIGSSLSQDRPREPLVAAVVRELEEALSTLNLALSLILSLTLTQVVRELEATQSRRRQKLIEVRHVQHARCPRS